MANSSNRRLGAGGNRSMLSRHPLAVACAAAFMLASNAGYAQDAAATKATAEAPQTEAEAKAAKEAAAKAAASTQKAEDIKELESVTVQGIRSGIENSIEKKKDATSIVEVVASEDIGKLPGVSIADTLARVPGVSAQRVAGRASTISVRGMAPDFSTTLLNGRDQVSVAGSRGVEYDQYPAELISSVVIYKTPDAALVDQGLSGTVDLRTLKPLDFADRAVAIGGRWEQNSLGEVNPGYSDTGGRFNATYIDQFADNTVGLALGIAYLDTPGQSERWRSWGYPTGTVNGSDNVSLLGGAQFYAGSSDNKRTGFVGVLQYRPSDTYTTELDIFYSKFDKTETTRGMEVPLAWSGATLSDAVIKDNVVWSGTYTGSNPVVRSDENKSDDDVFAIGWNNEFKLSEDWTAVVDLSMSRANRDDRYLELYAGAVDDNDNPLLDTVSYELSQNGPPTFSFGRDYSDPSVVRLTDASGWGQSGFVKSPSVTDELQSIRGTMKRDFLEGWISSVEFGVNYSMRDKEHDSDEYFIDLIHSPSSVPSDLIEPSPDSILDGGPVVIAYDVDGVYNSGLYTLRPDNSPGVINRAWTVHEDVLTAYAQMNIDTEWGSIPVRGNVGVQFVDTDQSSDGFATSGGGSTPYSAGTSYSDWLPSANLAFTLAEDQILHVSAARQIARAPIDYMRANNAYSCSTTDPEAVATPNPNDCRWSGSGGNPALKPTLANAYDVSWEQYFGVKAYISFAYFYKDLKTYTYTQTIPFDYSVYTPPAGLTPIREVDNYTAPANGNGGTIKGMEFTFSMPLNMFSQALDGFGTIITASDTTSSIKPYGPNGGNQPIPGLSELVTNFTLYYEKYGFSARINDRYRSNFIGSVIGFQGDRETYYIKAESIIDAQIGYDFTEGSLKGLGLLLQVQNWTDEPYREYVDKATQPRIYADYGRTVLLGASYKF